jgi:hypothetical protein
MPQIWSARVGCNSRDLRIRKGVEGGPFLELAGWVFLQRMFAQYLVADEVLVDTIQSVISLLESGVVKQDERIELNIHQALWRRRRSKS